MRARERRLTEIDALRGVAALTVMFWHTALSFRSVYANTRHEGVTWLNVLKYSPAHVLINGEGAVMLFFVISGFVLALPWVDGRPQTYSTFVVRRVARIWPAYLVACAAAFTGSALAHVGTIPALSKWFNTWWQPPVTAGAVLRHVALVDSFRSYVDPVLWTLVHEMRISIVFPLLVAAVLAFGTSRLWLAALVPWIVVIVHFTPPTVEHTDLRFTLRYLTYFVLGILIARNRAAIVALYRRAPLVARVGVPLLALVLYTYRYWMPVTNPGTPGEFAIAAGSALIVIVALGDARVGSVLRTWPLQVLGRISYSLYLLHAIVVIALFHALYGRISTWLLVPLVWATAIAASIVVERAVERPFIALGRRVGRRSDSNAALQTAP